MTATPESFRWPVRIYTYCIWILTDHFYDNNVNGGAIPT